MNTVIVALLLMSPSVFLSCQPLLSSRDLLPPNTRNGVIGEFDLKNIKNLNFTYYDRGDWGARVAMNTTPLLPPVQYVVIHHSASPPACYSGDECFKAMRSMQNMHMDKNQWWDIGYNFAVGSDGAVYEGRGWKLLGAHSLHFNTVSIGICLIGDWTSSEIPVEQLETTKSLIKLGLNLGVLRSDYRIIGHRQVRNTECPGEALFGIIKKWNHYSKYPSNEDDVPDAVELSLKFKDQILPNGL